VWEIAKLESNTLYWSVILTATSSPFPLKVNYKLMLAQTDEIIPHNMENLTNPISHSGYKKSGTVSYHL
jgi:hypothetical protein